MEPVKTPDVVEDEDMVHLVLAAKDNGLNPVFANDGKLVPHLTTATKVALYRKGQVQVTYSLGGDNKWRKC